jgi:hypothetical protein
MASLLERLRLPHPALVLVCSVFGTPLFYYGSVNPGHTHAFETLLLCGIVALLYWYFQSEGGSWRLAVAMGALLAFAMSVRYFDAAIAIAILLGLAWYRRWRDVAVLVATPLVGLALAALVAYETVGGVLKGAYKSSSGSLGSALGVLTFAPLNPVRMLFTDHRGLFLWSPVTVLALFGFILLLRRRPAERPFLAVCAGIAVAIVLSYAFSPFWDGGAGSNNQRYYTTLFPFVALGLGGLLEWRPRVVRSAAAVAAAWTVSLGLFTACAFGSADPSASTLPRWVYEGRVTAYLTAYNLYRISNLKFFIPDPFSHSTHPRAGAPPGGSDRSRAAGAA